MTDWHEYARGFCAFFVCLTLVYALVLGVLFLVERNEDRSRFGHRQDESGDWLPTIEHLARVEAEQELALGMSRVKPE